MDFYTANLALFGTALGFSILASYFDLKTGEIPDKFTIGLVIVALALRAVFSFELGFDYLLDGLAVGSMFFGFGALLFYTGGWGGGDAKLIAGIGVALGGFMGPSMVAPFTIFPAFFGFFVALSIVAIPYSLGYAFILSLGKREAYSLMREKLRKEWILLAVAIAASVSLLILLKPYNFLLLFLVVSPTLFYLIMVFSKSVERVAMQKGISVKDLEEGDMVVEDVVIGGKKVASRRDMDGLSKEQLKKIKSSKLKKIKIKWGIRFAPAFPLALMVAPFWTGLLTLFF
jgi:Flp pilus assembly protein protease CpaA